MTDFAAATDRSTPGLERGAIGDWILRNGRGETGRANSCTPHGDPGRPVEDAVDAVEAWFDERGRPTIFQIYDETAPEVADALLERGYSDASITDVLSAPIDPVLDGLALRSGLVVDVVDEMPAFLADQLSPARAAEMNASTLPRWFATASIDGEIVGGGMALGDGDLVGVFAMRTDPDRQGLGAGTAVVAGLLGRGRALGAETVWLQVEASNRRAADWYRRLGLVRRTGYRYRRRPST